jgi:hypothetical protein
MRYKTSVLTSYIILLVVGIVLALVLPTPPSLLKILNITNLDYRLAIFTLILPFAIIWFSAFYAYEKLEQYAHKLRQAREEKAFKKIADGVRVLAWGLIIPLLISLILMAIASRNSGFRTAQIIIDNYLMLLVPLIGFTYISSGTRALNVLVGTRPGLLGTRLLAFIYIIIGVLFSHFVVHNSNGPINPYRLSFWLLVFTIIIPYLYAWFIGLLSTYELWLYAQKTQGLIYKKVLGQVAGGLAVTIVGSICWQYLGSAFDAESKASFSFVFIIFYVLLFVQAVGYGLMAFGARRLKRIEEV